MNRFFKSIALATLAWSFGSGFTFVPKKDFAKDKPTTHVEYDVGNTVFLRGPVDGASVSKAVEAIEKAKGSEVYLFIQSPGGSVIDGMTLVNYIRSSDKKIVCVADVAISMAFVTLQACDERLSTANSIAMQHHMAFGAQFGEAPNVKSFVDFLLGIEKDMNVQQAKRIGLTLEAFEQKVDRDWWTFGESVAKNNVTDRQATSTCSRRAIEGEYIEEFSMFGLKIELIWSTCPHILEPKGFRVSKPSAQAWGGFVPASQEETSKALASVLARRWVDNRLNASKTAP